MFIPSPHVQTKHRISAIQKLGRQKKDTTEYYRWENASKRRKVQTLKNASITQKI